MPKIRVATYNINDIRKRLAPLRAWVDVTMPDVICLQELKCVEADFPFDVLRELGYEAIVFGQRSWNGVAILAKEMKPIEVRRGLPGEPKGLRGTEARYIEAAVSGMVVGCCYMPNGNPWPGAKFQHKLEWLDCFNEHAASLLATGHPVVLAGDYNIVPSDADIYSTRSYKDNALLQPEPRAAYRSLLNAGWVDSIHRQSPDKALYTFWSYQRHRWQRDAGLRIDHLLLSPSLQRRMLSAGVDRAVRGMDDSSDHAPAWVDLNQQITIE